VFGAHTPTQAAGAVSATHAWLSHVFGVVCHMPSEPQVRSDVDEKHCVAPGGQLPVHTPLVQRLVQGVPSFIQSPASVHRCGDLLSVPPHCRTPGLQLPVHAPAVQRKGQGASPAAVHLPAFEQRMGFKPSHFFASGVHSGAPASAVSGPVSAPIDVSVIAEASVASPRLASTAPP
jgi:hypothetical protein